MGQAAIKIGFIAIGGAVGSLLRFIIAGWVQAGSGGTFPVGTLCVNVAGCLVIGLLVPTLAGPLLVSEAVRVGLLVGVLGGFTTFSTFGFETFSMLNEGHYRAAALNVAANNLLGLIAVAVGYRVSQRWFGV